jgi:hypothetical protein
MALQEIYMLKKDAKFPKLLLENKRGIICNLYYQASITRKGGIKEGKKGKKGREEKRKERGRKGEKNKGRAG